MDMAPITTAFPGGEVTVWLQVIEEDDELICGIKRLEGRIKLPPKAWLQAVRFAIGWLEGIAKDNDCAEIRVAGRDWSRVLTDYEHVPGGRNLLRKRL